VIINDLIDMRNPKHRRDIENRFKENLKNDRARTRVLPISQFGILEMTRQRMRPSLKKSIYIDCHSCHGMGSVRSAESVVLDVMRQLVLVMQRDTVARLELTVSPDVAFQLLNRKRSQLVAIEQRYAKPVMVRVNGAGSIDFVLLAAFDARGGSVEAELPTLTGEPALEPVGDLQVGERTEEEEAAEAAAAAEEAERREPTQQAESGVPEPEDDEEVSEGSRADRAESLVREVEGEPRVDQKADMAAGQGYDEEDDEHIAPPEPPRPPAQRGQRGQQGRGQQPSQPQRVGHGHAHGPQPQQAQDQGEGGRRKRRRRRGRKRRDDNGQGAPEQAQQPRDRDMEPVEPPTPDEGHATEVAEAAMEAELPANQPHESGFVEEPGDDIGNRVTHRPAAPSQEEGEGGGKRRRRRRGGRGRGKRDGEQPPQPQAHGGHPPADRPRHQPPLPKQHPRPMPPPAPVQPPRPVHVAPPPPPPPPPAPVPAAPVPARPVSRGYRNARMAREAREGQDRGGSGNQA
jgi:ribonuclease E